MPPASAGAHRRNRGRIIEPGVEVAERRRAKADFTDLQIDAAEATLRQSGNSGVGRRHAIRR
jgi:hypothetical protein